MRRLFGADSLRSDNASLVLTRRNPICVAHRAPVGLAVEAEGLAEEVELQEEQVLGHHFLGRHVGDA